MILDLKDSLDLFQPYLFTQTAVLISILSFIAVFFNFCLPVLLMNCFPPEKHHPNFKRNSGNKKYTKTVLFIKFIPDPAFMLFCSPEFTPFYH
jgi:hypothetical protein